jgi:hypothetical protein
MDRSPEAGFNRSRGIGHHHMLGPLIWIGILLSAWAMIAEWRTLPELANAAMAALP